MPTPKPGGLVAVFRGQASLKRWCDTPTCPSSPSATPGGARRPYRVVLVATDLSGASRSVFPAAAILARRFGARVVAVHVAPRDTKGRPEPEHVRAFLRPDFEEATVRIEGGAPWRAIVRAAEEEEADLIAVARHGADSVGKEIFGSTTDGLLRHARCPVLVA